MLSIREMLLREGLGDCRYFHGRGIDDDKGGIVPAIQVRCLMRRKRLSYATHRERLDSCLIFLLRWQIDDASLSRSWRLTSRQQGLSQSTSRYSFLTFTCPMASRISQDKTSALCPHVGSIRIALSMSVPAMSCSGDQSWKSRGKVYIRVWSSFIYKQAALQGLRF